MKKRLGFLLNRQFVSYIGVGLVATLGDWCVFYMVTHWTSLYFQWGVFSGLFTGTIIHFFLNKTFTFQMTRRLSLHQITAYILVSAVSFLLNFLWMYVFVQGVGILKMPSRILTTGIMLMINFVLHKKLSFKTYPDLCQ